MTGAAPTGTATDTRKAVARILVIDDEENIRSTLSDFFSMNGYDVRTAEDGAQAIDLLGQETVDLIVSDIRMPGVDGIALIEWIRSTLPDVPVVIMTGHATVETAVRALRLGAYDYLLKPFTLDEIERTIGLVLERTRLRRQNTELAEWNERLREIERIKDDLLATVSHEFRTPLTAMKGFLTLMGQQGLDNLRPDQRQALDAVWDNADRLDTMIGNLLTLTEVQDGTYRPVLEPMQIDEFFREYVRAAKPAGRRLSFPIEWGPGAATTKPLVDRSRFPLVISNLLDNAYKFAREPGGGRVVVRVRREAAQLVIEVHDDGIGFSGTLGETVFERFWQADMTSTREHQGAGLGLAVVREIVTAHGGRVRLIPPVLGGASIRITLPVPDDRGD